MLLVVMYYAVMMGYKQAYAIIVEPNLNLTKCPFLGRSGAGRIGHLNSFKSKKSNIWHCPFNIQVKDINLWYFHFVENTRPIIR